MPPHAADLACRKEVGNSTVSSRRRVVQVLPVTATVILGPAIAMVYHLTQPSNTELGSLSLAQIIRGLLCAMMLLSLYFSRGLHLLTHRLVRPLLFLAAYAVLTSFTGPYPYQNVVFAVRMAFITMIFVNALQLAAEGLVRERWLTTCAWIVLSAMTTCIGVGLITGRTVDAYNTRYATAGLMNHVSVTSFFLLSTLPVLIRCIAVGRSAIVAVGIVYISLFFTMCRSALIAAIIATCCSFLIGVTRLRGRIPWRTAPLLMGLLLLLAGIGLSTAAGADLIARFKDLNPYDGTGSGRYIFWKLSLEHIMRRPMAAQLWGEGMGGIRDVLKERFGLAIGSHNDWLDIIYAFGLFGLIGIAWWHFELIRFVWSPHSRQEGLLQGVCASVVILVLISLGTGGSFDPAWALSYAAMGFWAGHTVCAKQPCTDPFST